MNYWEILLTKQRERGRDGLTLPFLIGSQECIPDKKNRQNIKDLILEMTSRNTFETCVRFCMGTQTFVFEIRKSENEVYFPKLNQTNQDGLSVALFNKSDCGKTIEELIEKMHDSFQKTIDKGCFSAEPNVNDRTVKWSIFSESEDIPFIKNSFGAK